MNHRSYQLSIIIVGAWMSIQAQAQTFETRVVARGLHRPTGIAIHDNNTLYFTEVPNPGVPNAGNAVKVLNLRRGRINTVHAGEPEPVNLSLDRRGNLYWVCRSAGVILEQPAAGGPAIPVLTGLNRPSGIALDRDNNIFFTEVPTPGMAGGANGVKVFDGANIEVINMGEPEPRDVAVSRRGELYWTCKSAGVILEQDEDGNVAPLVTGLNNPVGIALDPQSRNLYWTEVPTPGVGGASGGLNRVVRMNLRTKTTIVVNLGDPEPTDVTVARNGRVYWTCSSAGVIVEARPTGEHCED